MGNELVLGDRQASRSHACFELDEGGATVTDAGSRHGISRTMRRRRRERFSGGQEGE